MRKDKKHKYGIRSKVIGVNIIQVLMILIIILIAFYTFQTTNNLISKIVDENFEKSHQNIKIATNLTKFFAELTTGLLNDKENLNGFQILITDRLEDLKKENLSNSLKLNINKLGGMVSKLIITKNEITKEKGNLIIFQGNFIVEIEKLSGIIREEYRTLYAKEGIKNYRLKELEKLISIVSSSRENFFCLMEMITNHISSNEESDKQHKLILKSMHNYLLRLKVSTLYNYNIAEQGNKLLSIFEDFIKQEVRLCDKNIKFSTEIRELNILKNNVLKLLSLENNKIITSAKNESLNINNKIDDSKAIILCVSLLSLLLSIILILYIDKILKPIKEVVNLASKIALGYLPNKIARKGKDEIGDLTDAFNEIIDTSKQIVNQTLKISKGDYEKSMKPRSSEDKLSYALISMTDSLRDYKDNIEKLFKETKKQAEELEKVNQELFSEQAKLEQSQNKLLEQSHQAGMAEVATNVIHNVGNVLNSINTTTYMNTKALNELELPVIEKVARLFEENKDSIAEFITTDKIGKMIPSIISEFYEYLKEEKAGLLENSENIKENVEHIQTIINMQQSYATNVLMNELESPQEIMTTAIRMNANSLDRHNIKVIKKFEKLSDIKTDKHKILQILINLITNAKGAFKEQPEEGREIICSIRKVEEFIEFEIKDNAMGILKENFNKIFTHGFTTKDDGHGFGLHNSANNAKQLGGDISLISEGVGKGATFILKIPAIYNDKTNKEVK